MIKRVLCILSNMNAGGAETFLMKMYRTIDRDKYQLDFCLSVKEKGYYDEEIEALGGRIYHITPKTESLFSFCRELRNIVETNNYKYVLRITANATGFLDLKIAKSAGATVCTARSSNSNDEGGIVSKLGHSIGKMAFLRYIDKKIAPSDLAAIYSFGKKAYTSGEVTIIRNALDLDYYHFNRDGRLRIRKEFCVSEDAFVIGHIGRFMTQKNHSKLVDIFCEIQKETENAMLLLVGNGELEADIRKKVNLLGLDNHVIFAGLRRDVPDILSAMDVLIMPSLYEGMPNTVIEAQATGLPCVISDTITREANITGLVDYISLDDPLETWVKEASHYRDMTREDTKQKMISSGYDINNTAKLFINTVFDE